MRPRSEPDRAATDVSDAADRLRVLHVVSGFRPWLNNGLVAYAEDIMDVQVRNGHAVAAFVPGRHYPLLRGSRLHRWRRGGVRMYEWLNCPIVVGALRGTRDPLRELDDRASEEVFARVVDEFAPDLVHVHDLAGLPSSVLDMLADARTAVVMTLQDYFLLCPTVRLYDADGDVCVRSEPGPMCAVCCRDAPRDNALLRDRTLGFEGQRMRRLIPGLQAALASPPAGRALAALGARLARGHDRGDDRAHPAATPLASSCAAPPHDYQRRRDVNVERLNRCGALLSPSQRVIELHEALGVDRDRLRLLPTTLSHLAALTPRRMTTPAKVTFAVLNAMPAPEKGSQLVVDALDLLRDEGLEGRFRLLVGGWVPPQEESALRAHAGVELIGFYTAAELDALLAGVDVGIVPSLWEEVLGFVGLEFLAKGIPVIGNAMGGIPQYTLDGETGWLNRSCTARELAAIMATVIRAPAQVIERNARILAHHRAALVQSMEDNAARVEAVYREVLGGAATAPATTTSAPRVGP